jgi:L-cysteate sulfo-lyase
MPRLTKKLDGPQLYIKRDDLTGLAFGGNKLRKLEFLLGDACAKKADIIISGVQGFQSNHLCQTAAAATKLGMDVILVKTGPHNDYDPTEYDGNHLLQYMFGAQIRVYRPEHAPRLEDIANELKAQGRTPYIISDAGSTSLGTIGYVNTVRELLNQTTQMGIHADYIVHATGSGGTQAGLVLGAKALNTGIKIIGVSVTDPTRTTTSKQRVSNLVVDAAKLLNVNVSLDDEDITILDDYSRKGYGVVDEQKVLAIQLLAQTEGIFTDPVYSGTALAGLIDLVRKGRLTKEHCVIFLHTGGNVALFPYRNPITSILKGNKPSWTTPSWSS